MPRKSAIPKDSLELRVWLTGAERKTFEDAIEEFGLGSPKDLVNYICKKLLPQHIASHREWMGGSPYISPYDEPNESRAAVAVEIASARSAIAPKKSASTQVPTQVPTQQLHDLRDVEAVPGENRLAKSLEAI